MKTRLLTTVIAAAIVLACSSGAHGTTGTRFTWQGRLLESGQPVTNSADLQFRLFDDASGTTLISGPVVASDVTVVDGLLTVDLDFGVSAFDGAARFLEVAVRVPHDPSGAAPFTTLSPLQPVNPTPYALHAATAASLAGGGLPPVYAEQVAFAHAGNTFSGTFSGSHVGTFSGNGSALTALNAAQLTTRILGEERLAGEYPNNVNFSNPDNQFDGNFTGSFHGIFTGDFTGDVVAAQSAEITGTNGIDGIRFPDGRMIFAPPRVYNAAGRITEQQPGILFGFHWPTVTVTISHPDQVVLVIGNVQLKEFAPLPLFASFNIGYRPAGANGITNLYDILENNPILPNPQNDLSGINGAITGLAPGTYEIGIVASGQGEGGIGYLTVIVF